MPPARPEPPPWQSELARAYRSPAELLATLGLDPAACGLAPGEPGFPFRVTRSFAARMRRGDPRDPLLLQVLPLAAEDITAPGFVTDPVGDLASVRAPGLLQKYAGRALLVTTGACAVNCRYCFRRHYPYAEQGATGERLEAALALIAADDSLEEIILSGGDPLVLADHRLAALLDRLDDLPHVRRIRLHSRVPVLLPERVDPGLLGLLRRRRAQVVMVVHANHANELDAAVQAAMVALRAATGTVLNQSVLLRGINDSVTALAGLSKALFAAGVMPYYLHQLDPVAGAAHFAVPDAEALALVAALANSLPGYLVPKLVREVPGEAAKQPVARPGAT